MPQEQPAFQDSTDRMVKLAQQVQPDCLDRKAYQDNLGIQVVLVTEVQPECRVLQATSGLQDFRVSDETSNLTYLTYMYIDISTMFVQESINYCAIDGVFDGDDNYI